MREDLDISREENNQTVRDRAKAEHDAEAYAELRGAHAETQRELRESREETLALRRELASLKTSHAHKIAREQELERDLARAEKDRKDLGLRETKETQRADDAERDLSKTKAVLEELQHRVLQMEDLKARLGADLQEARTERDALRLAMEATAKKKKKGDGAKSGRATASPQPKRSVKK